MKADFKKRLRNLQAQLSTIKDEFEALRQDHEDWKDEHDYGWDETPTGEKADDDQYNLQDYVDQIESLCDEIEDNLNE